LRPAPARRGERRILPLQRHPRGTGTRPGAPAAMNLPELPPNASRRDMRKAILRLRMEMHRQEIRHESQQLLQPLRRARGFTSNLSGTLGLDRAPAWGIAALAALGFLTGRRRGLL